jgi:hypothetical protein
MARFTLAIEDDDVLEVDKLKKLQDYANKTGNEKILFDYAKQQEEENKQAEDQESEAEDSTEGDPEAPSEDAAESTDEEAPTEGEEDVDPAGGSEEATDSDKGSEKDPALEELRNLTYQEDHKLHVGNESFGEYMQQLTEAFKSIGITAFTGLKFLATNVGLPFLKGVGYSLLQLLKLLAYTTRYLGRQVHRYQNSFSNLESDLKALRSEIESKVDKKVPAKGAYRSQGVINNLKIGDSVNLVENISKHRKLLSSFIDGIDKAMHSDIEAIHRFISYSYMKDHKVPKNIMRVPGVIDGLRQENVSHEEGAYIVGYITTDKLPGDMLVQFRVPHDGLDHMEEIKAAYNASSITLKLDVDNFTPVEQLHYMNAEQLTEFIKALEGLCDTCKQHVTFYEKVKASKNKLKFSYKKYIMAILESAYKVDKEQSMVDYIYLKNMFIDKVYLTAAVDLHDYTSGVIRSGIQYARSNLSKL